VAITDTRDVTALLAVVGDAGASLEQRIAAADALAERGDPRVAARTMVAVPAGVVQHQAARGAASSAVEVGAFSIGLHLVTVAELAEMIDAGGYDDPALWSQAGWAWKLDHDVECPRFWDEPDAWEVYLRANRPVVGVSVFEAEAYAAFVGKRLPTELEWERACRGDDNRAFPWGEQWNEEACGHRDYGPRCTFPIGVFPEGLSPYGLHDMVGNV
jgi:formylglycine-generating enzyme required for sulfatase activity